MKSDLKPPRRVCGQTEELQAGRAPSQEAGTRDSTRPRNAKKMVGLFFFILKNDS